MTRLHDMGGRFGDGPVKPEAEDAPVFSEEWHARAFAIVQAAGSLRRWNIDVSRHARERLSPKDYAKFSYFERWISALADLLVENGVLTEDDLRGVQDDNEHPLASLVLKADAVAELLAKGSPADRQDGPAPVFSAGQAVRVRIPHDNTLVSGGHTRLPQYIAGAQGYVMRLHGNHVFPDSNAHKLGEAPEPLYAVRFHAREVWAHAEHPDDELVLDLWQSYLEPA
ncbi:MAG: nitrile hydratase subunit beta [Ruegeria sp.]